MSRQGKTTVFLPQGMPHHRRGVMKLLFALFVQMFGLQGRPWGEDAPDFFF
jgi:hypothetical protein